MFCILLVCCFDLRGIHITTDLRIDQEVEPLAVAKLLKEVVDEEKPELVLLGKQSIDGDFGQTGPMLAGMLGWPQVSCFFSDV